MGCMDSLTRGEQWRISMEKRRMELLSIWEIIFYGLGSSVAAAVLICVCMYCTICWKRIFKENKDTKRQEMGNEEEAQLLELKIIPDQQISALDKEKLIPVGPESESLTGTSGVETPVEETSKANSKIPKKKPTSLKSKYAPEVNSTSEKEKVNVKSEPNRPISVADQQGLIKGDGPKIVQQLLEKFENNNLEGDRK